MTPRQYNELQRQATVTKTRVQRFVELQDMINHQINTVGKADTHLAKELDELGDQLTGYEVSLLYSHYEGDEVDC